MKKIFFIGTGNMASAIAGGIIKSGLVEASCVYLFDKNPEQYNKFDKLCKSVDSIEEGINLCDYIFLSVKPQNISEILDKIAKANYENRIFVSICAGITIESIERSLKGAKIIRTMPNTPLLLGQGVTAICKNDKVEDSDFTFVKSLFESSGYVSEIDEKDINALTAITSSSPAYFYLFAKSILEGAKLLNFNYNDTVEMICRTMIGSANMILSGDKSLDDLISMVKSPNGTTEKALNVFEDNQLTEIVCNAMLACAKRAEELSKLN